MNYVRIDAFDMNFEECSVSKKYKLNTKGMGEKRIYVGHDEEMLDEFFDLEHIESFFILKNDLIKYLIDSKEEFMNPTQSYTEDIKQYYKENVTSTNNIKDDLIKIHFSKKYDSQNRYYLNYADNESSKNWDYFRNIALPRVTKLNFVKIRNIDNNKLYIYVKPTYYNDLKIEVDANEITKVESTNTKIVSKNRPGQQKYREEILDKMPACIITGVTDDRILIACHIKPHNICSEEEKYDKNNGLTMTPTYHLLFDLGFITFNDDGTIIISAFLSNMNKARLNLVDNKQYKIPKECHNYLEYHRDNIFNRIPDLSIIASDF